MIRNVNVSIIKTNNLSKTLIEGGMFLKIEKLMQLDNKAEPEIKRIFPNKIKKGKGILWFLRLIERMKQIIKFTNAEDKIIPSIS